MPASALKYHTEELAIARNPSDPRHRMPPFLGHSRILDVGCGMGQTLLAANLPPDVEAWGLDVDPEAIEAGRKMAPANVHLSAGTGERLQFPDASFDLVYCRVAIHHMHVMTVLREMHRVLQPGGDLWLQLHSFRHLRVRLTDWRRRDPLRGFLYSSYIAASSVLFHVASHQLPPLAGKRETFQTVAGFRRSLQRAGFADIRMETGDFFIAQARKMGA